MDARVLVLATSDEHGQAIAGVLTSSSLIRAVDLAFLDGFDLGRAKDFDAIVVTGDAQDERLVDCVAPLRNAAGTHRLIVVGDGHVEEQQAVRAVARGADFCSSTTGWAWTESIVATDLVDGYELLVDDVVGLVDRAVRRWWTKEQPMLIQVDVGPRLKRRLIELRTELADSGQFSLSVGDQMSEVLSEGFDLAGTEPNLRLAYQIEDAVATYLASTEQTPRQGSGGDDALSEIAIDLPTGLSWQRRSRGTNDDVELFWNSRFTDVEGDGSMQSPFRWEVGEVRRFETAIEDTAGAGAVAVDASDFVGGKVEFLVRAEGDLEVAPAGSTTFGRLLRSGSLECTSAGTSAFPLDCRRKGSSASCLRVTVLSTGGALLERELAVGERPGDAAVEGRKPDRRPELSLGAVHRSLETSLRLDLYVESGDQVSMQADATRAQRPWNTDPIRLGDRRQIDLTASATVRQMVELARGAYPGLDPSTSFALGAAGAELLHSFAVAGWDLHHALFGRADEGDRGQLARSIARMGGDGSPPPVLQVVDRADLIVPWGLLYDSAAWVAACEEDGQPAPDRASAKPKLGEVDVSRFWAKRFDIYRAPQPMVDQPTAPVDDVVEVAAVVNPTLPPEVVERQRSLFDGDRPSARVRFQRTGDVLTTAEEFLAWAATDNPCHLLFLFCHASAALATNEDGYAAQRAASNDLARFGLGAEGDNETEVSLRDLFRAWSDRRAYRPLVLLHGCGTTRGDELHGRPFVRHFFREWGVRALVGTDWTVPVPFADRFSARLVDALGDGLDLVSAHRAVVDEALDAGNPYGVIYAVWGQPTLLITRSQA